MGPKKRKSKEIEKEPSDEETPPKPKKITRRSVERKETNNEKAVSSKYFKDKSVDPGESSTSSKSPVPKASISKASTKHKVPKLKESSKNEPISKKPQKTGTSKSTSTSKPKPSTSKLVTREITVDQTLNIDTVKKFIQDKEKKKINSAKRIAELPPTEYNKSKNETLNTEPKAGSSKFTKYSKPKPSTSKSVTREVTVNETLNVDTVMKMIQDKENKRANAAKRMANLPPTEFKESTNENSQNTINTGSMKRTRDKNKDTIKNKEGKSKKKEEPIVDFADFPNVTKYFLGRQVFGRGYISNREVQMWYESKKLLDFKLLDRQSFFDTRITSVTWNKAKPHQFAFSDKHGNMVVGHLQQTETYLNWKLLLQKHGPGPGGNVLAMKFAKSHKPDHYALWNVGLEGTVVRFDCSYNKEILPGDTHELNIQSYLPTNDFDHWYSGMDLSPDERLVAVGCTKGFVQVITPEGDVLEKFKATKNKILNVEFCAKNPLLLSISSLDQTVKIWDRRYVKSMSDYIAMLPHNRAVNSAYFNERCDMLLTTDQYDEIRTYDTSSWRMISSIYHPHRQFQHLTPIKATWHPTADIIIAGRYPMERSNEQRCLDLFTVDGQKITTLDSTSNKIQSVARFSPDGKYIMSSFGSGIELWGTKTNYKQATKLEPGITRATSDDD